MKNQTRQKQEKIFRELYENNKGTPMATSSESLVHKALRYKIITSIFEDDDDFSVHDVGMGLADLNAYIRHAFPNRRIEYSGSEIVDELVATSRERYPQLSFFHRDLSEEPGKDTYDYVVMSGVFHQRRDSTIGEWEDFSQNLLRNSFRMCKKGVSFNFISPFVDFYQTNVYYCNLPKLLNFINDDLSRFFEIKHNYALFEFTVHVYKEEFVSSQQPEDELSKYFRCYR